MSKIEKLELRHLAGYWPYGLKYEYRAGIGGTNSTPLYENRIGVLQGISNGFVIMGDGSGSKIESIKPLLRKLSDLTKEIEHDGKRFVPIQELINLTKFGEEYKSCLVWEHKKLTKMTEFIMIGSPLQKCEFKIWLSSNVSNNEYWVIQKLISWHFDVFGLIGSGLAIEINNVQQ